MEKRATSMEVVLAGLEYVWRTKLLLGSISLDLFAVLLGGATALLPIFATDILHAGPRGLGLLRAMPSVGALAGLADDGSEADPAEGGRHDVDVCRDLRRGTVVFGLSNSIWPSSVRAGDCRRERHGERGGPLSGCSWHTPPEMRGRVSAVNSLFIGASNEFGEFESGVTAQWWGAVSAVVIGGIGSLAVTGIWSFLFPALRNADQLTPEALLNVEVEQLGQEVRQL